MIATQPACDLIGHEGVFRLPGGRATYEAVLYNDATARADRPRLSRLESMGDRLRQINRWVDWDQPIEVIRDYTAERIAAYEDEVEATR